MTEQTPEVFEKEQISKVEWIFPEDVSKELREGSEKIIEEITLFDPDIVIALKRKGSLVYSAVEALASKMDKTLPTRLDASIGREISDPFLDEDEDFQMFDKNKWEKYEKFLEKESQDPKTLVSNAITKLVADVVNIKVKKVFIVDDSAFGEATIKKTAPFIVSKAFGKGAKISGGLVFSDNNGWDTQIRDATFNFSGLKASDKIAVKSLFTILMKGEYDEGEFNLHKSGEIKNWEDIVMLGTKITENPIYGAASDANPADILKEKYSVNFLLNLKNSFIKALQKEVVRS